MTPQEFLEEGDYTVEFAWIDKNTMGDCNFNKKRIRLSIKLLVVDTFIHEYLHAENPDWSEAEVLEQTPKVLQRMTIQEIDELYEALMDRG